MNLLELFHFRIKVLRLFVSNVRALNNAIFWTNLQDRSDKTYIIGLLCGEIEGIDSYPKLKKLLFRNLFNVLLRKVNCRCTILTFIFVLTKRTALSEHILIYILGNISNMRKRSGLYSMPLYPDRHYEYSLLPTRVIPIKSLRLLETLITTSPSMPLNF